MTRTATSGRYLWSGYLLGFALGGFFDGILLHQILQWHHLLSTINPEDIRFQVAADGYFHALMYIIAATGLWLLWASRNAPRGSGRLLFGSILIGFGFWHVIDSVLSHWLLGIHRIRMDSSNPLFWDLLWLGLFGIAPLILGWLSADSPDEGDGLSSRRNAVVRSTATLLVLGAGAVALWPPQGNEFTTVLFAPGTSQGRIFEAVAAVGGELVWTDRSGELVVIRIPEEQSGLMLFGQGAILVSGAGLPSGCFNYVRI
ncbi:DUF2243 domain-containing protein [Microvirga makkahensis]|uniref:DUF2243 domain-containing protein n=1 Tax=Microvirga makkahensis TaxID=1128670 RepID=UPI0031B5EFAC